MLLMNHVPVPQWLQNRQWFKNMESKHQLQEENSKLDFTKITILSQRDEVKKQSTLPIDKSYIGYSFSIHNRKNF